MSAYRDRLLREGVVFAPRYGWVEFAIPHFDDYVRRNLPPIEPPPPRDGSKRPPGS